VPLPASLGTQKPGARSRRAFRDVLGCGRAARFDRSAQPRVEPVSAAATAATGVAWSRPPITLRGAEQPEKILGGVRQDLRRHVLARLPRLRFGLSDVVHLFPVPHPPLPADRIVVCRDAPRIELSRRALLLVPRSAR